MVEAGPVTVSPARSPSRGVRGILAPVVHWTAYRRLLLIMAVERGEVSLPDVLAAHRLSFDEWGDWVIALRKFGGAGLKSRNLARRAAA